MPISNIFFSSEIFYFLLLVFFIPVEVFIFS